MGVATGESKFPWADLVVFNTIAMLDVNFFNPDTNSLLSKQNSIGKGEIIRKIYFLFFKMSPAPAKRTSHMKFYSKVLLSH